MELSDNQLIGMLLGNAEPRLQKGPAGRKCRKPESAPLLQTTAGKKPRRRCTCGTCAACEDEARWERIFREKFADPTYYTQPLRRKSSLVF